MAVQKTILTEALTGLEAQPVVSNAGAASTKTLAGTAGTLALGKPGDIWSRAYGPLVYALNDSAVDLTFGTFVAKKGILVNGNDVANRAADLQPTTTLKAGQTGAFMTAGAAVVLCSAVADILAGMNARVILGYDANKDYTLPANADEVCVVEVNGLVATSESSN